MCEFEPIKKQENEPKPDLTPLVNSMISGTPSATGELVKIDDFCEQERTDPFSLLIEGIENNNSS